jgi:hypothetical protein
MQEVVRLYQEGWTGQALGERFRYSERTIFVYLERAGVASRPPGRQA